MHMYSRLYVYADSVLDAGGVADQRTNKTYRGQVNVRHKIYLKHIYCC